MKTSLLSAEKDFSVRISDSDFQQLREIVYRNRQIYLGAPQDVEATLLSRMKALQLKAPRDYLKALEQPHISEQELDRLLAAVLEQPPRFFEGERQWAVIKNFVLPQLTMLAHMRTRSTLRMVSLGPGCGVEAITLFMLYQKYFRDQFPELQAEFIALADSEPVYQSAVKRNFSNAEVEYLPEEYVQMFFEPGPDGYRLQEGPAGQIQFGRIDPLEAGQWAALPPGDLVMCRNVLANFETERKQVLLENIYHSMNDSGYLFIGPQESLFGVSHSFKRFILNKAVAFRRMPG